MEFEFSVDKTSATYLGISLGVAIIVGIIVGGTVFKLI